jgi:NAD(P)-dependent dehydrogenase (short-subunit alcohol dehydrogenase family)
MLLKDKIALVTGSTHNIGLAIARAFAREGARVVVHSRHEGDAKNVAQEINGAADFAPTISRQRRHLGTRRHADWTKGDGQPQTGV